MIEIEFDDTQGPEGVLCSEVGGSGAVGAVFLCLDA